MQYSVNYALNLPEGGDFYNVQDFDANFIEIDAQMMNNAEGIADNADAIIAEAERAAAAEEALESNLNAEITQALSAEETRAKAAEAVLTANLTAEVTRAQNAEDALDARLSLVELILLTDVAGNPFTVTFDALDGITVQGVWNTEAKRIEF